MIKTYYELLMKTMSPIRIGGGGNENTDSDLLLNGKELPFIPGTSLAGALRDLCESETDAKMFFGDVEIATADNSNPTATSSLILVSDGELYGDIHPEDVYISERDGVGLDEWGMAIKGAKYDFEIAEVKKEFRSVLECNFENSDQKILFEQLLKQVLIDGLYLGARTSRGYGHLSCRIRKLEFSFPEDLSLWLAFRPFESTSFDGNKDYSSVELLEDGDSYSKMTTIKVAFELVGNMCIRVKEANAVVKADGTNPDDVTIKNQDGIPIIPGTAWAGCFRHHMLAVNRELGNARLNEADINRIFGKGKTGEDSTKSILSFSESVIDGGIPVITMRNSVDRFTAAPTNGALFTNESWHNGRGELYIRFDRRALNNEQIQLLAIALMDLNQGMMTIGGGAGIGKGIVKITRILVNDQDKTVDMENYSFKL